MFRTLFKIPNVSSLYGKLYILRGLSSEPCTKAVAENGIGKVIMCHKATRNSLSIEMMEDLIENINQFESDPNIRVIIVGAEGPVFSSGHNLKELSPDQGRELKVFQLASQLMCKIIDCSVPIIAQVDGVAAAAGCQLVAQCDLAFCSEKSQFSTPGANFGIFCSTPGIALGRCMQKTTAMKMLLTGLPISAKEAESAGLITKVCSDLDGEVKVTCDAIMTKSRSVIELGKRFYYKQINEGIRKAYEMGEKVMVDNLHSCDGQEGIRSFMEKRKPEWKHR